MKILLINHYAGSTRHGMEYRPFYLSREWMRMGHDVTIVAASHSHLRTVLPEMQETVTEERIEGVHYLWIKTPEYAGNGVRRTLNMFAFVRQLYRRAGWLAQTYRPDAVIASSTYPLDNAPARRIARLGSAKLVYEVHDLWPLSPIELGGMSPLHPFILLMQWAENYAYAKADRVVSMLPKAEEHMRAHGLAPGKFAYVPNGIDVAEWQSARETLPEAHEAEIERLRREGRFLIGYAGSHGIANALPVVLAAAAELRGAPITFVLVGQGPEKSKLQEQAQRDGLSNVVFLPPVPKAAIPALLDRMDGLLLSWNRVPIYRFGISPNKLMDYMMAAKPVIQAIEAGNDIVAESGCGFSVPPECPSALAEAAQRLMRLPPGERAEMGRRGREYVLQHHDYRSLARQFLDAIG